MTGLKNTGPLTSGAIVGVDLANPVTSLIRFQYNPKDLKRNLTIRLNEKDKEVNYSDNTMNLPDENINLSIILDATEQLSKNESYATSFGIYPQLSALEMLVYPKVKHVISHLTSNKLGRELLGQGKYFMTLFIWGNKRILPIRLTQFSISEQMHDAQLNPIRAEVELSFKVLSYNNLPTDHPGFHLFLTQHMTKEAMATLNTFKQ